MFAVIALGSNQNQPFYQLQCAVEAIAHLPKTRLLRTSSAYQTSAVGPIPQDDFVNAVVEISTTLTPRELLLALQNIEKHQGRIRELRWGPRVLDLDIILYGDRNYVDDQLTIPHPEMSQRLFVLQPLANLMPDLHLQSGESIQQRILHLQQSTDQCVSLLESKLLPSFAAVDA